MFEFLCVCVSTRSVHLLWTYVHIPNFPHSPRHTPVIRTNRCPDTFHHLEPPACADHRSDSLICYPLLLLLQHERINHLHHPHHPHSVSLYLSLILPCDPRCLQTCSMCVLWEGGGQTEGRSLTLRQPELKVCYRKS